MKKFIFLHCGLEQPTPEIMDAWHAWFESIADKVVDQGGFRGDREITKSGTKDLPWSMASITGYSIVEAESLEAAEERSLRNLSIVSMRVHVEGGDAHTFRLGRIIMPQEDQDRRIDYIEFPVLDLEEAKRFYSTVFGWSFTDYGPDYASFSDGRLSGGFFTAETIAAGGPLVVLYALALEEVKETVVANGGGIVKDTFAFPGGRRFHFRDPSGHVLAVWSDQQP